MKKAAGGKIVNRSELAQLMGKTLSTVTAWIAAGCPVVKRGRQGAEWELNTAEVVAWLIERAARESGKVASFDQMRGKKLAIDTAIAELDLVARRSSVIAIRDVAEVVGAEYATVRTLMGPLPGKIAGRGANRSAPELEEIVREEINEVLHELSADARFAREQAEAEERALADARNDPDTAAKVKSRGLG